MIKRFLSLSLSLVVILTGLNLGMLVIKASDICTSEANFLNSLFIIQLPALSMIRDSTRLSQIICYANSGTICHMNWKYYKTGNPICKVMAAVVP